MSSQRFSLIRKIATQISKEFSAVTEQPKCDICQPYSREGWVWTKAQQWVPCWGCSRGIKMGQELDSPDKAVAVLAPPIVVTGGNWISPSMLNAKVGKVVTIDSKEPKVVDIFSYVNPVAAGGYPNRQKVLKPFICGKCGVRQYYQPQSDICPERGCVGRMKEQREVHIRVIPHGKPEQILHFIHLLQAADKDWIKPKECPKCKGFVINCPALSSAQMFNLAKQVGLKKLKFKRWNDGCSGVVTV